MANLRLAIYSLLSADTTLTGLVTGRFYSPMLPENTTYPAINYREVSDFTVKTQLNVKKVRETRIQMDVSAKTQAEAETIKEQLVEVVEDAQHTSNGITITGVDKLSSIDNPDSEANIYIISTDFLFKYSF